MKEQCNIFVCPIKKKYIKKKKKKKTHHPHIPGLHDEEA